MKYFWVSFFMILSSLSFAANPAINQVGFFPKGSKQFIIPGSDANPVEIIEITSKKSVLTLEAPYVYEYEDSGEEVQAFDISALETEGTYQILRNGEILGNPFQIGEKVYDELTKAALKWFYFQRAGLALEAKYAGLFARALGHADTSVQVYGETRTISARKGWYDAGDYGKYIVNSGITVATLLDFYENYSDYAKNISLNIPREFKNLPEILEEIRWNLDWMLSMQDSDGSVFHKLTSLNFCGNIMPDKDLAKRFAIGKGITAALDFSGVMAHAYRIYKPFDEKYANKMLEASKKAYAWAKKNPKNIYKQPSDVFTGSYMPGKEDGKDEFRYAAAELFFATKDKKYLKDLKANPFTPNGPWWGDMNFFAVFRAANNPAFGDELAKKAKDILLNEANQLVKRYDSLIYHIPMHPWNWNWGSNSAIANNGMILLHAYKMTKNKKYLKAAEESLSYLLGKNPMKISYVTGFGYHSPLNPHHRPSIADNVDKPIPGMLVGGPHLGKQDIGPESWQCTDYASANKPALAYADDICSYATNEVAINWNAPLVYLAGALEAIYEKEK